MAEKALTQKRRTIRTALKGLVASREQVIWQAAKCRQLWAESAKGERLRVVLALASPRNTWQLAPAAAKRRCLSLASLGAIAASRACRLLSPASAVALGLGSGGQPARRTAWHSNTTEVPRCTPLPPATCPPCGPPRFASPRQHYTGTEAPPGATVAVLRLLSL